MEIKVLVLVSALSVGVLTPICRANGHFITHRKLFKIHWTRLKTIVFDKHLKSAEIFDIQRVLQLF